MLLDLYYHHQREASKGASGAANGRHIHVSMPPKRKRRTKAKRQQDIIFAHP